MTITLNRKFEIHRVEDDGTPEHRYEDAEFRRQQVIEAALEVMHSVLDQGTDGTVEESDFLLSSVAIRLMQSVHQRDTSRLLFTRFPAMNSR